MSGFRQTEFLSQMPSHPVYTQQVLTPDAQVHSLLSRILSLQMDADNRLHAIEGQLRYLQSAVESLRKDKDSGQNALSYGIQSIKESMSFLFHREKEIADVPPTAAPQRPPETTLAATEHHQQGVGTQGGDQRGTEGLRAPEARKDDKRDYFGYGGYRDYNYGEIMSSYSRPVWEDHDMHTATPIAATVAAKRKVHVVRLIEMLRPERCNAALRSIESRFHDSYDIVDWNLADALANSSTPVIVIGTREFRVDDFQLKNLITKIGTHRVKATLIVAGDASAETTDYSHLKVAVADMEYFAFKFGDAGATMRESSWDSLKGILDAMMEP